MDNRSRIAKLENALQLHREFQRVENHASLESFIRRHTAFVFDEEISWIESKSPNVDLEGRDADNNIVIVEVKKWQDNNNKNRQEHASIGQIIQYASKYITDNLEITRLFIVGTDDSHLVENACEFLQTLGLNICYISISDKLDGMTRK